MNHDYDNDALRSDRAKGGCQDFAERIRNFPCENLTNILNCEEQRIAHEDRCADTNMVIRIAFRICFPGFGVSSATSPQASKP